MGDKSNIIEMHQEFYEFWLHHRDVSGRVPEPAIDPSKFKPLLPNIVKIRNSDDGPRFTIVGTHVVDEYKQDFTGLLVCDHPYDVCRETYLSMIDRMNTLTSMVNSHGLFCYTNRRHLRTMESGFALANPDTNHISGYLVLVTVDHRIYSDNLYAPIEPEEVVCAEANIGNQAEFDLTMQGYQNLSR